MTHWEKHFKNYDLFMNNFSLYSKTLDFHVAKHRNSLLVLDDGCGTGNLTLRLLVNKHMVVAIDSELKSLRFVNFKCKKFKGKFQAKKMNGQKLDYNDNKFDGVSSMFVIPFVENNKKYLQEIFRTLKPKGRLIISAWSPEKNIIFHLTKKMEKEFIIKNILPRFKNNWNDFLKTSKINGKKVISSYNTLNLFSDLKKIGFVKIKSVKKNPYGKYAYFIICEKPMI